MLSGWHQVGQHEEYYSPSFPLTSRRSSHLSAILGRLLLAKRLWIIIRAKASSRMPGSALRHPFTSTYHHGRSTYTDIPGRRVSSQTPLFFPWPASTITKHTRRSSLRTLSSLRAHFYTLLLYHLTCSPLIPFSTVTTNEYFPFISLSLIDERFS